MLFAILLFILIVIAIIVLVLVAKWHVYRKAGRPGWTALVPIYSTVVFLEMTNLPLWWIVLMFIPIVNIFIFVILVNRVGHVFGRGVWFTVGLIFLPFIFYPIIGLGKATYANNYPSAGPMRETTRWALIGLLAWALLEIWAISFVGNIAARNTQTRTSNAYSYQHRMAPQGAGSYYGR